MLTRLQIATHVNGPSGRRTIQDPETATIIPNHCHSLTLCREHDFAEGEVPKFCHCLNVRLLTRLPIATHLNAPAPKRHPGSRDHPIHNHYQPMSAITNIVMNMALLRGRLLPKTSPVTVVMSECQQDCDQLPEGHSGPRTILSQSSPTTVTRRHVFGAHNVAGWRPSTQSKFHHCRNVRMLTNLQVATHLNAAARHSGSWIIPLQ